ncbi:MAG: Uma2 family endonuclease [Paracoccaceae bacterium]|nr:Uma2 family endonuclease [Paracoccaceae bacterium]
MTTTIDEHHVVGPLGSDFWRINVHPELIPSMAREFDWNRLGRRVMIDALGGIITWMNPSSTHADLARASDKVVLFVGSFLKVTVREKGDFRWKRPDDPQNVGLEPDAAFYIGRNADDWNTAFRKGGPKATREFQARTPPDLVVEVEVTHFDEDKPEHYARLGVREMWRVTSTMDGDTMSIEILDLQKKDGRQNLEMSRVLPGLKAETLVEAYWLAWGNDFKELGELLKEEMVRINNPEPDDENDSSPPTPSM